jgi:beta-lactamase regulating signal transducer with metallopeptidase domain
MTMPGELVDLLVRSSLLLALVWAATATVRRAGGSAAMRHMVWLLGMAALLVFPFVSSLLPSMPLPILPAEPAVDIVAPVASVPVMAAAAGSAVPPPAVDWGRFLQFLYLAVAAGLLGRLALGQFVLFRIWRTARPVTGASWLALVGDLKQTLGIRRPVEMRIARGPAMPMTWGTLRPRVLLPAEALRWTAERRRIVLLHELAHVARRDSFSRTAAGIVCALYWFHPAIWCAARRMRLEQERACDDFVLSLGATASAYARNLLDVAGAFRAPPLTASLSVTMARTSELETRLTAIIRCEPRGRSTTAFVLGSGTAALLATIVVGTAVPVAAFTAVTPAARIRASGSTTRVQPLPAIPPSLPQPTAARLVPQPVRQPSVLAFAEADAVPAMPAEAAQPFITDEEYKRLSEQHKRDLDAYNRELRRYNQVLAAQTRERNADLTAYNRRLSELQGNLAQPRSACHLRHSADAADHADHANSAYQAGDAGAVEAGHAAATRPITPGLCPHSENPRRSFFRRGGMPCARSD